VFLYNIEVKSWDVIIIGGGIIGLALSLELRKLGATVLIIERGEPGREASYAAGGMLVDCAAETQSALRPLATASARMYPEFVRELQVESGIDVDLRNQGTIFVHSPAHATELREETLSPADVAELEPALADSRWPVFYLEERSADPRALCHAALKAAKNRDVDFSSGDTVTAVHTTAGRVDGVVTNKTSFLSSKVVNCAGAWSGQISPYGFPTRPVKGQMLCLASPSRDLIRHVIRSPEIYIIPRSNGRILVGATVEEAGFDKRTDVATIQRLHRSAVAQVPELSNARILEDWAGLRPGTPDALPILGETATPGYYVATGHFRDGILLAPITARVMSETIGGANCTYDLTPFSPARFTS
jgi:glycine oxidase